MVTAGAADDLELTRERMWAFAPFRVASGMPAVRERLKAMMLREFTWSHARPGAPRPKLSQPPPAERLGEIAVPVLVVFGEGEMPALIAEAEFVAGSIAGARLVKVDAAGHFVNLEQPENYNQVVLDWLRRQTVP